MKQDGRDLLAQFRRLAPERRPIAIQRWSVRRVALAAGLLVSLALVVGFTYSLLTPFRGVDVPDVPGCGPQSVTVLMAQAVPEATELPCIAAVPTGWTFGGATVHDGTARFWLNAGNPGDPVVAVTLTASCDPSTARPVSSDEAGKQRFDDGAASDPRARPTRIYRFPGGCVTYDLTPSSRSDPQVTAQTEEALTFLRREQVVTYVQEQSRLPLCGAGVSCADR
jgi:hypothetical protein